MGLSGRAEPGVMWIQVGFAENEQNCRAPGSFWLGGSSQTSSQPHSEQGWPHSWTRQLRDVSRDEDPTVPPDPVLGLLPHTILLCSFPGESKAELLKG